MSTRAQSSSSGFFVFTVNFSSRPGHMRNTHEILRRLLTLISKVCKSSSGLSDSKSAWAPTWCFSHFLGCAEHSFLCWEIFPCSSFVEAASLPAAGFLMNSFGRRNSRFSFQRIKDRTWTFYVGLLQTSWWMESFPEWLLWAQHRIKSFTASPNLHNTLRQEH